MCATDCIPDLAGYAPRNYERPDVAQWYAHNDQFLLATTFGDQRIAKCMDTSDVSHPLGLKVYRL